MRLINWRGDENNSYGKKGESVKKYFLFYKDTSFWVLPTIKLSTNYHKESIIRCMDFLFLWWCLSFEFSKTGVITKGE